MRPTFEIEIVTAALDVAIARPRPWRGSSMTRPWLPVHERRRHKRVHFHFTPTSASWMNQVETWFSILQRQALARDSFENVRALGERIARYIRDWDEHATPFVWVKTADQILAKAVRKPKYDSGAGH